MPCSHGSKGHYPEQKAFQTILAVVELAGQKENLTNHPNNQNRFENKPIRLDGQSHQALIVKPDNFRGVCRGQPDILVAHRCLCVDPPE